MEITSWSVYIPVLLSLYYLSAPGITALVSAAGPIVGDVIGGLGLPKLGFVIWLITCGRGGPGTYLRLGPKVVLTQHRTGGSWLQHRQQRAYWCYMLHLLLARDVPGHQPRVCISQGLECRRGEFCACSLGCSFSSPGWLLLQAAKRPGLSECDTAVCSSTAADSVEKSPAITLPLFYCLKRKMKGCVNLCRLK